MLAKFSFYSIDKYVCILIINTTRSRDKVEMEVKVDPEIVEKIQKVVKAEPVILENIKEEVKVDPEMLERDLLLMEVIISNVTSTFQ